MSERDTKEVKPFGEIRVKKGKILCVILHEGKGSSWILLDQRQERFTVNGNTYFKEDSGTYVTGLTRFMLYLEGISLPIHHGYIEREVVEKTIKNRTTGLEKKVRFQKIKGLKFDSKIIDILLNRGLADEFTRQHLDLPNLVLLILVVAILIVSVIGVGVQFR